ncbi:TPA: hypothetical protein EYP70_04310 [Candidatus Bathyarchaeota archaeon]|nr:hypothetical protein [Candidatus Bathyarchaeota archaeon]
MYQLTIQDVTYRDYPIQYFSSPSTRIEEIDIIDVRDSILSNWVRERLKRPFYHSLISLLETDLSSIRPHFEIKTETSTFAQTLERRIPEYTLEFDIVVRMQPMKEWSARVRVKSIEKAKPSIVEPEGFG